METNGKITITKADNGWILKWRDDMDRGTEVHKAAGSLTERLGELLTGK